MAIERVEVSCGVKHPLYGIACRRVEKDHRGVSHIGILHGRFWVNWLDAATEPQTDTQVFERWQKERRQASPARRSVPAQTHGLFD